MQPLTFGRSIAGVLMIVTSLTTPCSAQVQNKDGFKASSVIKKFTGQNGFEEIMLACEQAADPRLVRLRKVAIEFAAGPNPGAESQEVIAERRAAGIPDGATLLQVRELAVARHRQCLELLRKGIEKPIHDPRADTMTFDTLFSDFSRLMDLVKVALMAAATDAAYGRHRHATDNFLLALTVGESLQRTAMIGHLVANGIYSMVFGEIEKRQAGLGINEWQRLEEWARRKTEAKDDFASTLKSEHLAMLREIDSKKSGTDFIRSFYTYDDEPDVPEQVKKMSEATAAGIRASVRRRLEVMSAEWMELASGDESNWLSRMPEASTSELDSVDLDKVQSPANLESALVSTLLPSYREFVVAIARMRTQFRLLGLYAKVQGYRLHHDKLPVSLADVATEAERDDPHSGSAFVYELREDGTFRVYSKGFSNTGEIEFRYRRPKAQTGTDFEPPTEFPVATAVIPNAVLGGGI